jgi:hypothetical protein
MSVSDRPAGGGGRAVLLTLLAVFFLAVIGSSVGYIAALRYNAAAEASERPSNGATTTARRSPKPPPPEAICPTATEQAAEAKGSPGSLRTVIYVRTDQSEAWVCRDSADKLWYQGHRRSAAEQRGGTREPFVDGDNSLFLTTVEHRGDEYVATNKTNNGTTYYHVSAQSLTIENPGGNVDTQTTKFVYLG